MELKIFTDSMHPKCTHTADSIRRGYIQLVTLYSIEHKLICSLLNGKCLDNENELHSTINALKLDENEQKTQWRRDGGENGCHNVWMMIK